MGVSVGDSVAAPKALEVANAMQRFSQLLSTVLACNEVLTKMIKVYTRTHHHNHNYIYFSILYRISRFIFLPSVLYWFTINARINIYPFSHMCMCNISVHILCALF